MVRPCEIDKHVARNLKVLMDDRGLNQHSLGGRAGVAQRTVGNILTGESSPRIATLHALAQALGVETWRLLLPDIPADMLVGEQIGRVCRDFLRSGPDGRAYIESIASREAASSGNARGTVSPSSSRSRSK